MTAANAAHAGDFLLGGEQPVHRLGFGAMRITGAGIWGEPADRAACLRTLARVPELGINFIDTADSYGPVVSERLLHEALHPYPDMIVATKGGQTRTGPDQWVAVGRPEYLLQQAHMSRRWLGVEQIDLWQLHRIDPKVPQDEQFDAIKTMRDQGLIRHAGLSEVTVEQIKAAQQYFPVATVQNRYNLGHRDHEAVLEYCADQSIGFIPWRPLAGGDLMAADSPLQQVAERHDTTAAAIALAWLLARSPVIIPIPGTADPAHLESNIYATELRLSANDIALLEAYHKTTAQ